MQKLAERCATLRSEPAGAATPASPTIGRKAAAAGPHADGKGRNVKVSGNGAVFASPTAFMHCGMLSSSMRILEAYTSFHGRNHAGLVLYDDTRVQF